MNYAFIENGKVTNIVVWDGIPFTQVSDGEAGSIAIGWSPPEGVVMVSLPGNSPVGIDYTYDGVNFTAPPKPVAALPSVAQILSANTSVQAQLLAAASVAIAPLQLAVSLGEATSAETVSAAAWVAYTRAVKAIDLTQVSPTWPAVPA